MQTTTRVDHPPATASRSVSSRCLRLAAVREEFGLSPLLFGVGEIRIGSDPQADFPLPFHGIAAEHIVIEFDGQVAIAASQHPMSWLNDGPFRRSRLKKGDRLALGPIELAVDYVEVPEPPPVPRAGLGDSGRDVSSADAESHLTPLDSLPVAIPDVALQSLLEEAEAGRNLRDELRRLQDEVARLRTQSARNDRPVSPLIRPTRTPAELPLARGRRHAVVSRSEATAADLPDTNVPASQPQASTADTAAAARQFAAQRAELDRERELLAERQIALERERREFDSAVEALDDDRRAWSEQLQREKDAHESLARQLAEDRKALDATAAALQAQSQELTAKGQRLAQDEESLGQLRRDLATQLQLCEQRSAEIEKFHREVDSRNGAATSVLEALRQELQVERDRLEEESARLEAARAEAAADRAQAESLRREVQQQAEEVERRRNRLAEDEALHREAVESLRSLERHLLAREAALEQATTAQTSIVSTARTDEAESSPEADLLREQLRQLSEESSRLRMSEARLQAEVDEWKSRAAALERAMAESPSAAPEPTEPLQQDPTRSASAEQAATEWMRIRAAQQELDQVRESLDVRGKQLSADRLDHERAILTLERARAELQEARRHLDRESQALQSREDLLADQESILDSRWQELRGHERRIREAETRAADVSPIGSSLNGIAAESFAPESEFGVVGESSFSEEADVPEPARHLTAAEIAELPLAAQIACFLGEPAAIKSPMATRGLSAATAPSPSAQTAPQPTDREADFEQVVATTPEATEEQGNSIRSQLAALFGIPRQEIDATERRHPELAECPGQNHSAPTSRATTLPLSAGVAGSHSQEGTGSADPVAEYMEKLLGRYQQQSETTVEGSADEAADASPGSERTPAETVEPVRGTQLPTGSDSAAGPLRRRPDGEEIERMKAELMSMRQLANLSARSAVATHHSRQLGLAYQVKLVLTMLAGLVTIALLTAELWGSSAYYWQGLASLAVTVISGSQLLRTSMIMHKMQRRAQMVEAKEVEIGTSSAASGPPAEPV